ncbi:ATP-binding protein [Nanoarchaeota archaeon]
MGREYYLNLLKDSLENLKRDLGENLALVGPKNIGKSYLLKEFVSSVKDSEVVPVYIDLERAAMSPEEFCFNFISQTCYWFKGGKQEDYKKMDYLLKLNLGAASKHVKELKNELEKIKPDHNLLVDIAFKFPEALAKQEKKKVLLIIDEFQNILDLNNFEKIKDIVKLFNSLQLENVKFVVAGSSIQQMREICTDFKIENIGYFEFDGTKKLVQSLVPKISDKEVDRIFKLSLGHPYFITAICNRYNETKDVDQAYIIETLSKQGLIYQACNQMYNNSLSRARGKTLLMSIMNVLVYEEGLRLSEISRRIYRQSPVTKNLLSRLISVDLLALKENRYYFIDPVLKFWLSKVLRGLEFDGVSDEEIDKLVKEIGS